MVFFRTFYKIDVFSISFFNIWLFFLLFYGVIPILYPWSCGLLTRVFFSLLCFKLIFFSLIGWHFFYWEFCFMVIFGFAFYKEISISWSHSEVLKVNTGWLWSFFRFFLKLIFFPINSFFKFIYFLELIFVHFFHFTFYGAIPILYSWPPGYQVYLGWPKSFVFFKKKIYFFLIFLFNIELFDCWEL